LADTPIDLSKIRIPSFILATREDHIAPWKSTYAATRLYSGPIKFVLSDAGHMAGVISPPGSKYGHWANDNLPPTPDEWFAGATANEGSWWPLWDEWVAQRDGGRVPAREPGNGALPILEDAPGSYVHVRSLCSSPKRFDVDQFRDRQESHAAHGNRGRFHMASVSIPHHEKCPRCGSGSVHLEWRECVNAQEVQYLWHCGNCKNEFVTVVTSDEKEPPVTEITERFFTSLLV
jgi:hypothetical protein